ncbi:MAG: hypothetical protein AAF725_16120 [Acidobacteriota bacterium]
MPRRFAEQLVLAFVALGALLAAEARGQEKAEPSAWSLLTEDVSLSLSASFALSAEDAADEPGQGREGARRGKSSFSASFKYNPVSYWFAVLTAIAYEDPAQQQPWDPDFTFVIGYDDWHPGTFSVTYAHYGGNRFDPGPGESFSRLEEGTLSIGYKLEIPSWAQELFIVHPTGSLSAGLGLHLTPRYSDLESGERRDWKQQLTFSFKYSIYRWFYLNATLFYYPNPEQQQPWDPDFTYGFGYFDWHPGTVTVQYNNYSGNRYPGRKASPGTGRFEDGSLSISWSWAF